MSVEANKAVIRAFIDTWNSGDLAGFDDLMAEECVLTVGSDVMSCSPSSIAAINATWHAAFPDYHHELLDLIAEGDKVVARMPFSGTQTGPLMDIPATGKTVHAGEIVIFRVVDGKIFEARGEYDELGMRRQLGVLPSAPAG